VLPILTPSCSLVWIGYYSESHETFAPWFFHKDYSRFVFKVLVNVLHLCISAAPPLCAAVALDVVVNVHGQQREPVLLEDWYLQSEKIGNGYVLTALGIGSFSTFLVLEAGLLLGMRSTERPGVRYRTRPKVSWKLVFMSFNYFLSIWWLSLLALRQSGSPCRHPDTIYIE